MSNTITENRPQVTPRPITSPLSAAPAAPSTPVSAPANSTTRDSVRLSSEVQGGGATGNSSTFSLLQGLQDNYGNAAANPANANASAAAPADAKGEQQPPLSNEQKIEKLQSTLEQFKGLKGEELKKKLDELGKSDPELAKLLEKLLGEENGAKEGDEKKAEAAKEAKKTGGGDDGAPSETFLWKPTSDSDGKLAILLPSSLDAQSVTVSGPNFNESVSKGGRNGSRGNGQREHYRFSKPGNAMQGPVQVNIALTSGGSKTITINNPAERNEGGKLQEAGGQGAGGGF